MTETEELEVDALCQAFFDKVKMVSGDELDALGVPLHNMGGSFMTLEAVEDICRRFPHFHIFCCSKRQLFNSTMPGMDGYYIGSGDCDPTLTCSYPQSTPARWTRALKSYMDAVGPNPEDPADRFVLHFLRILAGGADMKDPSIGRRAREEQQHPLATLQ